MNFDNKLTSRKFLLCVFVQVMLFVFLWFGKLPTDVVQNLTGLIVTSYIIGNVSQKKLVPETAKTNEG